MLATEAQIRAIPTPPASGKWNPIGHGRFLDEIEWAVDDAGLDVTTRRFDLMDDDNQLFGTYGIDGHATDIPGEVGFQIGFRGSINKTLAQSMVFGTTVFVCSNGMMVGERILRRRNTTRIIDQLRVMIQNTLKEFPEFQDRQLAQYRELVDIELSDKDVHHFICEALRREKNPVMVPGHLIHVLREWHEPRHDFGDKTAWRLHNAFTEVAKRTFETNPVTATSRTISLNRMFSDQFTPDLPVVEATVIDN